MLRCLRARQLLGLLALAALSCGAAAQDAAAAAATSAPAPPADFFEGRLINVCTSDYAPISRCLDREPAQYTGYDIALMERISDRMGWAPQRLNWSCIDWYAMVDSLKAGDGACDVAVAGVEINEDRLAAGVAFSFPTLRGGYKIMVLAEGSSSNRWYFLSAFDWQLWIAICLTAAAVGLIVWAAERWAWIRKPPVMPAMPGLQERMWQALGKPMQTADMTAATFSASLIIVVFALMCLVLTTLYTSATTANLTAQQLQQRIRSVADLPGKRVATWEDAEYITDLAKRNIDAIGYPWNNDQDLEAMFSALRSGEVQAVVLDSYILDFAAGSRCDVATVGYEWKQYDQAVAFPAGADPRLVNAVNRALIVLKETGEMEALVSQYISPEARCKSSGVQESFSQVTFKEVSGLWILLAGSVAAALLVFLGGQLALCCARRVSRTQTYRKSMGRLQTVRGSLSQRGSISARHGAASGSDDNGETGSDAAAEAGLASGPADPHALSAAVAELAAQLQQALAAQEAATSGGGCKEHFK